MGELLTATVADAMIARILETETTDQLHAFNSELARRFSPSGTWWNTNRTELTRLHALSSVWHEQLTRR